MKLFRFYIFLLVVTLCACSRPAAAPSASTNQTDGVQWIDDSKSPYGPYQGSYAGIAEDRQPELYPVLKAAKPARTPYGDLLIPEGWFLINGDDATWPRFTDESGRVVLSIYTQSYYPEIRGYLLKGNHCDIISWQSLKGYPCKAINMALECDETAASGDDTITIRRELCFLLDGMRTSKNGDKWGNAVCLSFDKAYIKGNTICYVISNSDIDAIIKSFVPHQP